MRIEARCHTCDRKFLFFQLYNADPWHADRCPHCNAHLGVVNIRHLALTVDRAAAAVVIALEEIAGRSRRFSLLPETVVDRIQEAAGAAAVPRETPPAEVGPSLAARLRQRRAA